MTLQQKKNLLSKEKPLASLLHTDESGHVYWCETSKGAIHFKVPCSVNLTAPVAAELLIQWLN